MSLLQLPALLSAWLTDLTSALDRRAAPRLLRLFLGALFAKGRRTVTSWFRPAGIRSDFRRGYAALRPFLKPVLALGVVVFSRVRKDAHLLSLPPTKRQHGQRGPLPRYGKERIDLAKRAGQKRGWQPLACWQYGVKVVKQVKTFLATWRPAGGVIRVVLVREETGWLAYFCTEPTVSAADVLEVMAECTAIEKAQADYTSRRRWDGARRIGYHRRNGVARAGRVVPATPGRSHRRNRMPDTTRRPTPPRA